MLKGFKGIRSVFRKKIDLRRRKETSLSNVSKAFMPQNQSNVFRRKADLIKYERIYATDGVVFSSVNTLARAVVGSQWDLSCSVDEPINIVNEVLSNIDFSKFLSDLVRFALIYGNAFVEKIFNGKGDLVDLCLSDPKTIEIMTDEHGDVVNYIQEINDKTVVFNLDEMSCFHIYGLPLSPYGISVIGANYDIITKKVKVDEAISSAILHHGFPKFHVRVGSSEDDIIPSKDDIDDIASEFKNINSKNEFITPDIIEIRNIDSKGIEHIEDYTSYFLNLLTAGFGVPEESLGLGKGSTEASGKVRQRLFERGIRSIQTDVENFVTKEIFAPIVKDFKEEVSLQFRDISPAEEVEIIKWVKPLIETTEGTFAILDKSEIRKLFSLPVKEESVAIEKAESNDLGNSDDKNDKKIEGIINDGYKPDELYGDEFKGFHERFEKMKNTVKGEIDSYMEEEE